MQSLWARNRKFKYLIAMVESKRTRIPTAGELKRKWVEESAVGLLPLSLIRSICG